MFKIETENFEGPLDLLLHLTEKEKLNICEISLARITDSYLETISKIDRNGAEMAEFLVIAAKLLYIKSKQLLPSIETEEEEAEIADLEAKLLEYQKYKEAAKNLEEILSDGNRAYRRRCKNQIPINFLPPKDLDNQKLFAIFENVLKNLEESADEEEVIEAEKITIEDKRLVVRNLIKKGKKVSFKSILIKARTKNEVIVTFLAILEMMKQKEVKVSQEKNFADFTVEKI